MTRSIWGQVHVQQQISAEKVFPSLKPALRPLSGTTKSQEEQQKR